jgi:hypothetical protein
MRILPLLLLLALIPISMHSMEESSPEREEDDPMAYVPLEALAVSFEECIPEGACEEWICRFCLGCFFVGMAAQDSHHHF